MVKPTNAQLVASLRKEAVSPGTMTKEDFIIASLRFQAMIGLAEAARCIADQLERVGDTRPYKDGNYITDVRVALINAGCKA